MYDDPAPLAKLEHTTGGEYQQVLLVDEAIRTYLANALQDPNGMLKVTDVKDGHCELDVCIMTDAVYRGQSTGFTKRAFLGGSLQIKFSSISILSIICDTHESTV